MSHFELLKDRVSEIAFMVVIVGGGIACFGAGFWLSELLT